MRALISLVLTGCMLAACADKPPTQQELALAKKLEAAPAGSILILSEDEREWGMVCGRNEKGGIKSSLVNHAGVWPCDYPAPRGMGQSAQELAEQVTRVIQPSDPGYDSKIESLMLTMMNAPNANKR